MTPEMTVITMGVHVVDVLARPVEAIPEGQGGQLVEQIRITPAGSAGGTAVTLAKLHQIEARGEKAPENSVLDAAGKPTTNPTEGLLGTLLPMAGHRGFGLAVMWEIFTGVLAGGTEFFSGARMPEPYDEDMNLSFFMLAINPAFVMPYADFQVRVDRVIDEIHASPPAPGSGLDRIIVPGERSQATAARRKQEGIPIPQATAETLAQFGKELGIAWPGKAA